jgi:hypothetical protein
LLTIRRVNTVIVDCLINSNGTAINAIPKRNV